MALLGGLLIIAVSFIFCMLVVASFGVFGNKPWQCWNNIGNKLKKAEEEYDLRFEAERHADLSINQGQQINEHLLPDCAEHDYKRKKNENIALNDVARLQLIEANITRSAHLKHKLSSYYDSKPSKQKIKYDQAYGKECSGNIQEDIRLYNKSMKMDYCTKEGLDAKKRIERLQLLACSSDEKNVSYGQGSQLNNNNSTKIQRSLTKNNSNTNNTNNNDNQFDATGFFDEIVNKSTDECNDYFSRGVMYVTLGEIDSALKLCEKLLDRRNIALFERLLSFIGHNLRSKGLINKKYEDFSQVSVFIKKISVQSDGEKTAILKSLPQKVKSILIKTRWPNVRNDPEKENKYITNEATEVIKVVSNNITVEPKTNYIDINISNSPWLSEYHESLGSIAHIDINAFKPPCLNDYFESLGLRTPQKNMKYANNKQIKSPWLNDYYESVESHTPQNNKQIKSSWLNDYYESLESPQKNTKYTNNKQIKVSNAKIKPDRRVKARRFLCINVPKIDKRNKLKAIIEYSKFIENTLENYFNASGSGPHEKITSCESKLSNHVIKNLRTIATIRNKTLHESGYQCKDFSNFLIMCNNVLYSLDEAIVNESNK